MPDPIWTDWGDVVLVDWADVVWAGRIEMVLLGVIIDAEIISLTSERTLFSSTSVRTIEQC